MTLSTRTQTVSITRVQNCLQWITIFKKTSDKNEKSSLWDYNALNQTESVGILVPLSSSGLLARLRVVRPELGLWARAAANFCAKSLQSVKDCFHYMSNHSHARVCVCVCIYPKGKKALWKYADYFKYTPKSKSVYFFRWCADDLFCL